MAGAWSRAGEGEEQDLARAQLGWAAHTRLSRARSEGAQGMGLVGLQQRGGKCRAVLLE